MKKRTKIKPCFKVDEREHRLRQKMKREAEEKGLSIPCLPVSEETKRKNEEYDSNYESWSKQETERKAAERNLEVLCYRASTGKNNAKKEYETWSKQEVAKVYSENNLSSAEPCKKLMKNELLAPQNNFCAAGIRFDNELVCNANIRIDNAERGIGKDYYNVVVILHNGKLVKRRLTVSQYKSARWLYDIHGLNVYAPIEVVKKCLEMVLESDCSIGEIEYVTRQGWVVKVKDNSFAYLLKDGPLAESGDAKGLKARHSILNRPIDKHFSEKQQCVRKFADMGHLTSKGVVAGLLQSYLFLSLLFSVFDYAGVSFKFALFLVGRTGSMKTSLAIALTQPSSIVSAPISFRATKSGVESTFSEYADSVLLVDDYCPQNSEGGRKHQEAVLENLLRFKGDNNATKRDLNFQSDKSLEQYVSHGGMLFTGEFLQSNLSESSLARMLILNLNYEEVDKQRLSQLQERREIFDITVQEFLQYVARNFLQIVRYIRGNVKLKRQLYSDSYRNHHSRYAEYRSQLEVAVDIWVNFLSEYLNLDSEWAESLREKYYGAVNTVMGYNINNVSESAKPEVIITRAIIYEFQNGTKVIASGDSYWILKSDLKEICDAYCKDEGIGPLPYSRKDLIEILDNGGLLEVGTESGARRRTLKCSADNGKRRLKIPFSRIRRIIAEGDF